jgi:two-component system, OmpR family, response regulator
MKTDKNMKVFIVDDDQVQSEMLADHMSKYKMFNFLKYPTGEVCLQELDKNPDIIILDYYLDGKDKDAMDGIDVLKEIKKKNPNAEVVMLSGQEKIEVAVNTMKYGAFDYVVKGETAFHRLENVLYNVIRKRKLESSVNLYRSLSISLAVVLILVIFLVIYLYQKGYVSDNPGWF